MRGLVPLDNVLASETPSIQNFNQRLESEFIANPAKFNWAYGSACKKGIFQLNMYR